ncbi:MAG: glycosyltransferase family 47 protein [Granulosicoccus sp.]|nr:glycosyltransferase family 47 protein [Granulosicoccus sp.]
MNLLLTSAYDVHPGLDTMLQSAQLDQSKTHSLCTDASRADAIVFIENTQFDDILFGRLTNHVWVQEFPDKCFMYNEMDRPWDVLPGLYTCMTRQHRLANRHRAFAYLSTPNASVKTIHEDNYEHRWLFSFMGAMSHHCRRKIMRLSHDRAFMKDTSEFNVWNADEAEMQRRASEYARVLGESLFVMCPRGIGTSSIRLYETLEAGRVPVIVSDDWVPPPEADWSFAVQVQEKRVPSIPKLLESLEQEAIERGALARQTWLQHYAPEALFNTFGDAIESLCAQGNDQMKRKSQLQWNKWVASSGLITRTAMQKLRGQR